MKERRTFKYGDLEIAVESLQERGGYEEYGIKIEAPGNSHAFRMWHAGGASNRDVAHVLVYDLIKAYEHPLKFFQQHNDPSYLPQEMRSAEVNREFIRAAEMLKDFLHQAHLDVYREWSVKPMVTEDPIKRGSKEWFPKLTNL
jgi:hypothetical protein